MGHSLRTFVPTISIASLMALVLTTGCSLTPSPYDEQSLVALFPANGAAAVPTDTTLRIDAGWGLPERADVTGTLQDENGVDTPLTCERSDEDSLWFECTPAQPLQGATRYTFTAAAGSSQVSSVFTTAVPEGRGYEIGAALSVEHFGNDGSAATLMSKSLGDSGPFVMVAETLADGGEQWFMGPGKRLVDGALADYAVKADVGYPVALDVESDANGFDGGADHIYLPVDIEGQWRYMRLDEVTVTGTYLPGTDTIQQMEIEALVTSTTILRLASFFDDEIADLVIALCRPDLDTDGDGEADAALLTLTTSGTPADVH